MSVQLWELRGSLEVLYTQQPARKRPVFKEGCLKVAAGRAELFDSTGCEIDRDVLTSVLLEKLRSGDEVELSGHLVQPQAALIIPCSRSAATRAVASPVRKEQHRHSSSEMAGSLRQPTAAIDTPSTVAVVDAPSTTEPKVRRPFKRPRVAASQPSSTTLQSSAIGLVDQPLQHQPLQHQPLQLGAPSNRPCSKAEASVPEVSTVYRPSFPKGASCQLEEDARTSNPRGTSSAVVGPDLWASCAEEEQRAQLKKRNLWAECAAAEDAATAGIMRQFEATQASKRTYPVSASDMTAPTPCHGEPSSSSTSRLDSPCDKTSNIAGNVASSAVFSTMQHCASSIGHEFGDPVGGSAVEVAFENGTTTQGASEGLKAQSPQRAVAAPRMNPGSVARTEHYELMEHQTLCHQTLSLARTSIEEKMPSGEEEDVPQASDSEDDVPLVSLRATSVVNVAKFEEDKSHAARSMPEQAARQRTERVAAKKSTGNADRRPARQTYKATALSLPLRFAETVSHDVLGHPSAFESRSQYARCFLDAVLQDMQDRLGEMAAAWRTSSGKPATLPRELAAVARGLLVGSAPNGIMLFVGRRTSFVRGEAKFCGQGDLWALLLQGQEKGQEPLLVQAMWRGVSPQGKLLCRAVNQAAIAWLETRAQHRGMVQVTGLCLHDFRAELAQADALCSHFLGAGAIRAQLDDVCPLDLLAQPCRWHKRDADGTQLNQQVQAAMADLNKAAELSSLSAEQAAIVGQVGLWATDVATPCVHVVRGVFGSGKSRLLASCIALLDRLLASRKDSSRILLVCQTNVAVDNVLSMLKERHGWDDFARLGSFRNVKAPLLHRTVSLMATRQAATKELSDALERLPPEVCATLRAAVDRGVLPPRAAAWRRRRLVAATSAALEAASHLGSDATGCSIVLVDEATQLTEPAIAACLDRTQAHKLLLIGDPRQLPPRARHPLLQRSAIERLWEDERSVTRMELATQYRCHPVIADLGSRLFYGGCLKTGVLPEGRTSLLGPGVPPVVVVLTDGIGTEVRRNSAGNGSYEHVGEAKLCAVWIQRALRMGETGGTPFSQTDVGVVCLYRPQADACARALSAQGVSGVDSATVDAFQGGEREIIVLCCGRSSPTTPRDSFATCPRRLNVALSRSRRHLVVVGSSAFLEGHPQLRHVLAVARSLKAVHQGAVVLTG